MNRKIKYLKKFLKYFLRKRLGIFVYPAFKKELWLPVKDYEGLYIVSNKGRVVSLPRRNSPYYNFLTSHIGHDGYCCLSLNKNNKKKKCKVHRLVAQAFIPNHNNYDTVNHKNFKKWDNSVSNLEWMSNMDNVLHAIEGGRMKPPKSLPRKPVGIVEARICSRCFEAKPIEKFYEGYSWCKSCQKDKNTQYYIENRSKFVQNKYNTKYS